MNGKWMINWCTPANVTYTYVIVMHIIVIFMHLFGNLQSLNYSPFPYCKDTLTNKRERVNG